MFEFKMARSANLLHCYIFLVRNKYMSTLSGERHTLLAVTKFPAAKNSCSLGTEAPAVPKRCCAIGARVLNDDWFADHY